VDSGEAASVNSGYPSFNGSKFVTPLAATVNWRISDQFDETSSPMKVK